MRIHFSIDDVIETFRWVYWNNPNSIFDTEFYGTLKRWHEMFGLKVCLYAFGSNRKDFAMEMLPEVYYKELLDSNDWIRVAYHGLNYVGNKVINDKKFEEEQRMFANKFANILASTVRLHGWTATQKEMECAISIGK